MRKLHFLVPIGFLAVVAGGSAAVMLLWNWLMPAIFGVNTISFWQALGLFALCRILFGNFRHKHHRRHGLCCGKYKRNFHEAHEKWAEMTPEQREEFVAKRKEQWRKCGFGREARFDDFAANERNPRSNE
ncbi:MAG: hypothetical protein LBU90_07250 [Bacteroidales bacterium]|jgi:hypothetical protein|nr:hypothetical protein [Bacteroidales bacterium]